MGSSPIAILNDVMDGDLHIREPGDEHLHHLLEVLGPRSIAREAVIDVTIVEQFIEHGKVALIDTLFEAATEIASQ